MSWTRSIPQVDGWYWFKPDNGEPIEDPHIVYVWYDPDGGRHISSTRDRGFMGKGCLNNRHEPGEWNGPIPYPDKYPASVDILERLRGYNPPDRTVDEQRQMAVDIRDAAEEIERLRAAIRIVSEAFPSLIQQRPIGTQS